MVKHPLYNHNPYLGDRPRDQIPVVSIDRCIILLLLFVLPLLTSLTIKISCQRNNDKGRHETKKKEGIDLDKAKSYFLWPPPFKKKGMPNIYMGRVGANREVKTSKFS